MQKKPEYERTARECEAALAKEAAPSNTAAAWLYLHVMIPVLLEYVEWVLVFACRDGIRRLYFLARDGWQMYLAAKCLCRIHGLDLDCRYLHVSRFSLRVPEYALLGEECLEHICIGGIDVTFGKIMARAALTPEEARHIAGLLGYSDKLDVILSYQEIKHLKEKLRGNGQFFSYVRKHSREAYPGTMGYLEQEGMLEDVFFALVDSGWTGTLQQSLRHLLQTKKPNVSFKGYYFGLYELPSGAQREAYAAWYFDPERGLRRKVHFSNCLFEAIFSAPEGMTVGYDCEGQSWKFLREQKESCNQVQMELQERLLMLYLERYESELGGNAKCESLISRTDGFTAARMTRQLLSACMSHPTRLELLAYGDLLFSDDVLENDRKKISAELSAEELKSQHLMYKALIMLGLKKGTLRESAWIEGSIVKNGTHIRRNLWYAAWYKYFVYIRKMWKRMRCGKK